MPVQQFLFGGSATGNVAAGGGTLQADELAHGASFPGGFVIVEVVMAGAGAGDYVEARHLIGAVTGVLTTRAHAVPQTLNMNAGTPARVEFYVPPGTGFSAPDFINNAPSLSATVRAWISSPT